MKERIYLAEIERVKKQRDSARNALNSCLAVLTRIKIEQPRSALVDELEQLIEKAVDSMK